MPEPKPWLRRNEQEAVARDGTPIQVRDILFHPEKLSHLPSNWGSMNGAERKEALEKLNPDVRMDRALFAQVLMHYRKEFPANERQPLSAWTASFRQNYLRKAPLGADYHLSVAYAEGQEGPKLAGFSTMHITRNTALPVPIALAEYTATLPEMRRKGIFSMLWKRKVEAARNAGAKYIVGEQEIYSSREHREYLGLKQKERAGTLSEDSATRLRELESSQARMKVYSPHVKYAIAPYIDPTQAMTYLGGGPGILNRRGQFGPLRLFIVNLQNPNQTRMPVKDYLSLLRSVYGGPQALNPADAAWLVDSKIAPQLRGKNAIVLKSPSSILNRYQRKFSKG